jgi:putative SOS response-associated peptidase YedK
MCGRFVSTSKAIDLADQFAVDEVAAGDDVPDYNVAPRAQVMVVRQRAARDDRPEQRVLSRVRWGLVPSWAKDPGIGDRLINARAETVAEKPAYRRAFAKRRCIIPADGFYEWKVVEPPATPKGRPKKQPRFIHRRDDEPMAFAGLWEVWKVPEGGVLDASLEGAVEDGWLRSCVIVTTDANHLLAPVHDRMPVVLPASAWDRWLDPAESDPAALGALLRPAPDDWFDVYPVSTRVNRAANNDPELLAPVPAAPES